MKEGYYHLYSPDEKEPTLVHGYYCTDEGGQFVFGFNTHDGGGLVRLDDLRKESTVIPVTLKEPRLDSVKDENKEKGMKYLCEENDNTIEYRPLDSEFYIGHESGVGGYWVIGEQDLKLALMEFGITIE